MGKEQEGMNDTRGHENEQKREKNRLRQKNKRGNKPLSMHTATTGTNRSALEEANAFQQCPGHRSELWVSNKTSLILTTVYYKILPQRLTDQLQRVTFCRAPSPPRA